MTGNDDPRNADSAPREPDRGDITGEPVGPTSAEGYQSSPPPSPKGNRPWLIWAIAGVTTVLVVVAVSVAIVNLRKDDDGGGSGGGEPVSVVPTAITTPAQPATPPPAATPMPDSAAADELRSHMPAELRSATECQQGDTPTDAEAMIDCEWPSPSVPSYASYVLYADTDSMNAAAEELHRRGIGAQSCESADDFTAGGQMTWTSADELRSGTLWCYVGETDESVLVWTEDNLHILSYAHAATLSDWQALLEWFEFAGPE